MTAKVKAKKKTAGTERQPAKTKAHKWTFVARFRAKAYGWRGTALATKRLKEAGAEIKKVAKTEPVVAGEGVVTLAERLWPSTSMIDTSSGSLGNAIARTLAELIPILIEAPADVAKRVVWTERLYHAVLDDGVSYLEPIEEAWCDICGYAEVAERWANELAPALRVCWSRDQHTWFHGYGVCLGSLVRAGRYQEVDDLLALQEKRYWYLQRYRAEACVRQGRIDEALAIARACDSLGGDNRSAFCERILLEAGRREEAYKYTHAASWNSTNLTTFRTIKKKYPERDPEQILHDLAGEGDYRGKWFAAAKEAGLLRLAAEFASCSTAEPATLARAARDFAATEPKFAFAVALHSIQHFLSGKGYEPKPADLLMAYDALRTAAEYLGKVEEADGQVAMMMARAGSETGLFLCRALQSRMDQHRSGQVLARPLLSAPRRRGRRS